MLTNTEGKEKCRLNVWLGDFWIGENATVCLCCCLSSVKNVNDSWHCHHTFVFLLWRHSRRSVSLCADILQAITDYLDLPPNIIFIYVLICSCESSCCSIMNSKIGRQLIFIWPVACYPSFQLCPDILYFIISASFLLSSTTTSSTYTGGSRQPEAKHCHAKDSGH